ncbi:superoxide dismutase [Chloroflexota bacterium]
MRILALEVEKEEVSADDFQPLLIEEARKVWELYQDDFIREIYFRADKTSAILMLECSDIEEAKQKLSNLPLVSANLIDFELIPLVPYPGFSRLFESLCNSK